MSNADEPCSSIIPQVILDAALAGKEISMNVRKRRSAVDVDLHIEVEESSDEERRIHSKVKRSSLKQSFLGEFFTMPSSSGERWEPLHKQFSENKKTNVIRKRIAIDPSESRKTSNVSSVVTEVSSGDMDICEGEQLRLKKSVSKARRKSIKQYLTKERGGKAGDVSIQHKPKMTTPHRKKQRAREAFSKSPDTASLSPTPVGSAHSTQGEIIELDSAPKTPDNESQELEILCEVPSLSKSRSNKRSCYSTSRISRKRLLETSDFRCRSHNRRRDTKVPQTSPWRKLSQQRSFSPLNFISDDEQFIFPETPRSRRKRADGEASVFDLNVCGEEAETVKKCDQRQYLSSAATSQTTSVDKVHFTQSGASSVRDEERNASEELCDATAVPSTSMPWYLRNDSPIEKLAMFGPYSLSNDTEEMGGFDKGRISKEESGTVRNANISCRSAGVEIVDDHEGSIAKTSPNCVNDVESEQVSPFKSRSVSTLLYSSRKMELCNSRRLTMILAKAKNNFEYLPNLGKLPSDCDYCAFEVSSISKDRPPMSSPETCENADLKFGNPIEFVRLPWSSANIVSGFHHYIIIDRALRALVHDGAHCIEAVIVTLRECAPWLKSFNGLLKFMDALSPSEEREVLDVMAGIARLAVNAKFILTSPVPLLRANHYGSVTLSQEQCACLLAHAFFCTYRRERRNFNRINMSSIFDDQNPMCCVKLRFILHYFSIVLKKMPTGCVSFRREALPSELVPNWEEDQTLMPLMATASDTSIEDSYGCLQVDFANEYIGGGVLTWGAVQEEIRFLICPEMIVSCLLCEKMGPLEVVHIVGAQRYSSYVGYGETLCWAPYEEYGSEPRDEFRRVKCEVVAMDATLFKASSKRSQYDKVNIDRELNKAYVGFMSTQREVPPVATGNWGCGVFGGDKELKILIQMMAAAHAGRDMIYYTFSSRSFEYSANEQYEKMVQKKASVGAVYKALTSYQKERERNPRLSVFDHVYAVISEIACTAS